jgi:hypothetical protein
MVPREPEEMTFAPSWKAAMMDASLRRSEM